MSRYRGPKLRIIRRLGKLPGLTSKISNKNYVPGQHGPTKKIKKSFSENYGIRLREKQKLCFNYGVSENKLHSYVKHARRIKGPTGENIIQFLEMRLDSIVFKLGLAPTIASARQFISHEHIIINNQIVNIPSFQCKVNDLLSINTSKNSLNLIKFNLNSFGSYGNYLSFDTETLKGKITALASRNDSSLVVDDLLVVEYYSNK